MFTQDSHKHYLNPVMDLRATEVPGTRYASYALNLEMHSFHKTVTSRRTSKGMQCIVTLRVAHGLLCMQADNTATKSYNNNLSSICYLE